MATRPTTKSTEKDTSSDFFKAIKTKGSILKKAGKEEAPKGYTTPEEIIAAFKLKIEGKVTTTARCTAARCGVDKNKKPYVSFNFVCTGNTGKGQTPSKYIGLVEQGKRTEEQAYKDLSFTLQNLGFETDDLSPDALKEMFETIKADKPLVSITISRYSETGLDVRVNRPLDDEDADDQDEEDQDEDEEESDDDSEDDSDEDSDDSEENSDDDSDDDSDEEDNLEEPSEWVGQKATVKTAKMPKAGKVTLLSYDEKKKVFKAKNSKGEALTVKLDEVQEVG